MLVTKFRKGAVLMAGVVTVATLAGCSASGGEGDSQSLTVSVDNTANSVTVAEAWAAAFEEENTGVTVEVESRPAGADGDTAVKTRLNTGDLGDVLLYQSGSGLAALNPAQTLTDLSDEPWVSDLSSAFPPAVTVDDVLYGAPTLGAGGGGIIYNKKVYADLGLSVPKTWDEFIENSKTIKAAGIVPVIQTYKDSWTSQFMILNDYFNVQAAEPDFADEWTAGEAKFADTPSALAGFEHLAQIQDEGLVNEDYGSATYDQGIEMVSTGTGAQYPQTTGMISQAMTNYPDAKTDLGFFALPGEDASSNGATIFQSQALYIPSATKNLDLAKEFVAFVASPEGCDVSNEAVGVNGVSALTTCELPADVPAAIQDLQTYTSGDDTSASALEFVSPVKGPALPDISVAVGSGLTSPEDGAKQFDDDSAKQAQQLGLPGW